ncbi:MAG: ribosome maturation factor RimM [Alphaproteobacteria bacterium]
MTDTNRILVAVFTKPHGVHGRVRVKTFTENPETIGTFKTLTDKTGEKTYIIEEAKVHKDDICIAKVKDVKNRNHAEDLRGVELYITRDQLPDSDDDQIYYTDLIGLEVRTGDTRVGTVELVDNFGAQDLLQVTLTDGKSVIIPFSQDAVPEVNLDEGYIVVEPHYLEMATQ